MDTVDNAITKPAHRLEVFTGAGRRRTWSDEDKARILGEIAASGESVSAVARRHGLAPQQLFGWRRQAQASQAGLVEELPFVPAVMDVTPSLPSFGGPHKKPSCQVEAGGGIIEVEIGGVTVRVGRGADAKTVTAVLRALKDGT